jgi:hypothetical protein
MDAGRSAVIETTLGFREFATLFNIDQLRSAVKLC